MYPQTYEEAALQLMLSSVTYHPTDLARIKLTLHGLKDKPGLRAYAIDIIRAKRREYLDDACRYQRRWQRETRNPRKARHHDSIALRTQYVERSRLGA